MGVDHGCLHIFMPLYGFLSHTNKKQALALIRTALNQPLPESPKEEAKETAAEKILRLTGLDITRCPKCGGKLLCESLPIEWVKEALESKAPP